MPKVNFNEVDVFDEDSDDFVAKAAMRRRNNPAETVDCPSCGQNLITRGERDNGHLCEDCEDWCNNQESVFGNK